VDWTWEEVAINLIGRWKVKVNGQLVEFNALTYIDMASNLVQLIHIDHKTAKHIPDEFTQSWLYQYPCPGWCLHDMGGEFIGQYFQSLLKMFSIKDVCSTSKKPNPKQSVKECIRM
jgi:hypothetical protein